LDISNTFQNSIIFDPSKRVYITLPPFYLEWFTAKWPDFALPSKISKDLVLQCLKSIQGTKDAGQRWYKLISGRFLELGMIWNVYDHGVFLWDFNNERSYLVIETDDVLMASMSDGPFLYLQAELRKLFDFTCKQGNILKFLNLRIVQSPRGISLDQTHHITTTLLGEYFKGVTPSSIPFTTYLFPLQPAFERALYEAPPLVGSALQAKEKEFGFSYSHLVGGLMHITGITRVDLSYACLRFSGYMACPNDPIFSALHKTFCYLFHHKHVPIMYPRKPLKQGGQLLHTFWKNGQAEYLSADFGDELATFADADYARCLRSRRSVSSYCILFNGIVVSYGCKKQLKTALHTCGSETNALFKGVHKTCLLRDFLASIGFNLSSPTPTFEDNQGTIKLVKTSRLTDTVCHHALKLAYLKEKLDDHSICVAYAKTGMMMVDCTTKPINGAQLYRQVSYLIGQRFFPTQDLQHFFDLDLDHYAWLRNIKYSSTTQPP
jgi:hypothetical protein